MTLEEELADLLDKRRRWTAANREAAVAKIVKIIERERAAVYLRCAQDLAESKSAIALLPSSTSF